MSDGAMVEVELIGVTVEQPSNTPVVILRETSGLHRHLQIFIGPAEASAIAFALEGVETPRPMTHDLMTNVLETVGVTLVRVAVTEVRDTTFYGELHIVAFGETHVISSRPSDAVALAVRIGCPIVVAAEVLDEAGYVAETIETTEVVADPDEVVEEFRHFIDNVNPDDFAS